MCSYSYTVTSELKYVPQNKRTQALAAKPTHAPPVNRRRESSIFTTPAVASSRPSSVMSDASVTQRKNSDPTASTARVSASRTVRPSASAGSTSRRPEPPTSVVRARSATTSTSPPSRLGVTSTSRAPPSLTTAVKAAHRPSSTLVEPPLRTKALAATVGRNSAPTSPSNLSSDQDRDLSADATPVANPKARRASFAVPA